MFASALFLQYSIVLALLVNALKELKKMLMDFVGYVKIKILLIINFLELAIVVKELQS